MPIKILRKAPGMANAQPPGRAKFGNAPPPGLTIISAVARWGGGGGVWAQLELTDALCYSSILMVYFFSRTVTASTTCGDYWGILWRSFIPGFH